MIRNYVFSQGKLVTQDVGLDVMHSFLFDDDVQIWCDLENPTNEEVQTVLERTFKFHPLAIEDCVTVSEQPKVDEYENCLFLVLHAVDFSAESHEFSTTEIDLFIGKNFLVTYHHKPVRSIAATIDRINRNAAAVAKAPDRLTYTILDLLLDNYEPSLACLANDIETLETNVIEGREPDVLKALQHLKHEVQRVRQIAGPQREVIGRIARGEFKLIRAHLLPYFRDLQDRLVGFTMRSDRNRESLNGIMQTHLAFQQNDMNRVIKVLTVITVLSTPFQIITSFYGMNFVHMAELQVQYAHLYVLVITIVTTWLIYWLLRRKRWL